MPSKLITIGEILEMSPGDRQNAVWINDDFEAVLSDPKRGQGKAPNTAVLTDPHNSGISILGNFFGVDPAKWANKVVHISGKGISRTEYKGTQQVTIGDKATIQVVGDAKPSQAPKAGTGPTGSASGNPHGAQVGMAVNNAITILREIHAKGDEQAAMAYFTGLEFSKDLYIVSSDILRIARVLEAGKLADSPKHRADPDAAKREEEARKAKEEEERKKKEEEERKAKEAANQSSGGSVEQDDVPF